MKLITIILVSLVLVSCGRVETPEEFFDITGDKGKQGKNCYSEKLPNGVNIVCGDSIEFISNGNDGIDGQDGTNGQDGQDGINGQDGTFQGYLEYREVCPQVNGSYIETLIYLDGQYLAYMSSNKWKKQRLVIVPESTLLKTTDGRNVFFRIVNGEIICE